MGGEMQARVRAIVRVRVRAPLPAGAWALELAWAMTSGCIAVLYTM